MNTSSGSLVQRLLRKERKRTEASYRLAMLRLVESNPKAKLLDLGCYNGELTLQVAAKIGTKMIYGVELLPENACKCLDRGIAVHCFDLNNKFPFPDGDFDVVFASQIIEHLHGTDTFLSEIHRIIREPNGYVVISTPNLASWHNILSLILAMQPYPATVSDEICAGICSLGSDQNIDSSLTAHLRIFTLKALNQLLTYHGFHVEKCVGAGFYPLPFPLDAAMCHIDKAHSAYLIVKARKQ